MALCTLFFTLSLLSPLVSALPNLLSIRQTTTTETWQIPRLDMHMMTVGTGIQGNPPWPEDSKFDSTIDFDVVIPAANEIAKWKCQGAMANGTIIERLTECASDEEGRGDSLMFAMAKYNELGERRPELSFSLWLYRNGYACHRSLPHAHGYASTDTNADYHVGKTATWLFRHSRATQLSQRMTRENRPVTSPVFREGRMMD